MMLTNVLVGGVSFCLVVGGIWIASIPVHESGHWLVGKLCGLRFRGFGYHKALKLPVVANFTVNAEDPHAERNVILMIAGGILAGWMPSVALFYLLPVLSAIIGFVLFSIYYLDRGCASDLMMIKILLDGGTVKKLEEM